MLSLLAFMAAATPGTFVSGNELWRNCSETTGVRRALCINYVLGVQDAQTSLSIANRFAPDFCVPGEATSGQLGDVVAAYLKDNPAERHKSASSMAIVALALAFPCR